MKIVITSFTIFLILLVILVIFIFFSNCSSGWRSTDWHKTKHTESFVNFQKGVEPGSLVYIPQYSSDTSRKVTLLYDNLYFDQTNATLLEVDSSASNASTTDVNGNTITMVYVTPREGDKVVNYPTKYNNSVIVADIDEAQIGNIASFLNAFAYKSSCANTDKYEVFYTSWDKETYLHIMKIDANKGENIISYYLNSTGVVSKVKFNSDISNNSSFTADYGNTPDLTSAQNNTSITPAGYLGGKEPIYQITPYVYYDTKRGYIVIKTKEGAYLAYSRSGVGVAISPDETATIGNITGNMVAFTLNDNNNGMVLVSSYGYNTVINVMIPNVGKYYNFYTAMRFAKDIPIANSVIYASPTNPISATLMPGATASATPSATPISATGSPCSTSTSTPTPTSYSQPTPLVLNGSNTSNASSVCGDDLSCKWYWYFNTLAKDKTAPEYFKEDYFLKTEVVPPVCPTCPNCPFSGGPCTNCGGCGGAGMTTSPATTSPATTSPATTSPATTSPATTSPATTSPATTSPATTTKSATTTSPGATTTSPGATTKSGSTTQSGSITQSRNPRDYVPTQSIINKSNHDNTHNNTFVRQSLNNGSNGSNGSYSSNNGYANTPEPGGTSPYSMNNDTSPYSMNNETTPIDNYSQYGALQSKGCNYMPVTADFSAFRK